MNNPAGFGSMMIRNLRNPADYKKAVMTQDELLRIAIANDSNIARARKDLQLGVPPPIPQANLLTAEQLALDVGKQEGDALRGLLDMGFTYDEASQIVAKLNPDQIVKFNASYPAVSKEFANKYNVSLITPTFMIDYLQKFFEELDASKGVASAYGLGYVKDKFDELIDTTNELKAVIPTTDQIRGLMITMERRFDEIPDIVRRPIMERLQLLDQLLPDSQLYARLDELQREDQALAYKLNQELQNSLQGLPSREQVERTLMDLADRRVGEQDALRRIEMVVDSLDQDQLLRLQEIKGLIQSVEAQQSRVFGLVEGQVVGAKDFSLGSRGELDITFGLLGDNKTIVQVLSDGKLLKMDKPKLDKVNKDINAQTGSNPGFTMRNLQQILRTESDTTLVMAINSNEYSKEEGQFEDSALSGNTTLPSVSTGTAMTPFKSGKGLAKVPKRKVATGISTKKEPPYRQLGKYVIHWKQLNDNDMLNVKYKSLGRIPQFKPVPVSDVFKEYVVDVLETGKHNQRHYEQVPIEERKMWEKIVSGAGLGNTLKIKKTISNNDKDDMERFEMLKGQYLAGNNNVSVIRELRRFVVKFLSEGKLKRNQALDLLLELSV
jgi:hypothetical protein